MFQSCELLESRPQANEGLEKGMNFMMRDVTENSEESKKCCRPRQPCYGLLRRRRRRFWVNFFQTSSAFGDLLDLSDHPLLLDIFSQGPRQLCTGLGFLFFFKVSFEKHPNEHLLREPHFFVENKSITSAALMWQEYNAMESKKNRNSRAQQDHVMKLWFHGAFLVWWI